MEEGFLMYISFWPSSHPTETIFVTALSILHRQMLYLPEETRPKVKAAGGPVHLAALLTPERFSEPLWLAICADALRMTAYEDPQVKVSLIFQISTSSEVQSI